MFLQGSSNAAINGGQFTNIQGSQHTTNIYLPTHQERELTIWDDYWRVRTGDVYITRIVGNTAVKRDSDNWRSVMARRTVSLARVGDKEKEFLHVAYDGPDAFKVFEMDFKQFSSVRHPNFAQLFGYNNNPRGLPALVFYDELIPLRRILFMDGVVSPALHIYFDYLFDIMQIANVTLDVDELWVDQGLADYAEAPMFGPFLVPNSGSLATYKDTTAVFGYLIEALSIHAILQGISWSSTGVWEWFNDEDAIPILQFFAGAVYNRRQRKIITKPVGARARWFYGLRRVRNMPDTMRESRAVMEDGSERFMVTPEGIQGVQEMSFRYALYPEQSTDFEDSWVAQAHSIFSRLGIHEDRWEEYCVCDGFKFVLQCKGHISFQGVTDTAAPMNPVYLFIQPVPYPSDDEMTWKSWIEGKNYFWTSDPSGQEKMSEATQASLGLPSFTSCLYIGHRHWWFDHYETVEKLHRHCGFNPRTTELTHSLGLFILEVIDGGNRFQTLEEADDDYTPSHGSDSDEETILYKFEAKDDYTPSESSEHDLVVYPRSAVVVSNIRSNARTTPQQHTRPEPLPIMHHFTIHHSHPT